MCPWPSKQKQRQEVGPLNFRVTKGPSEKLGSTCLS